MELPRSIALAGASNVRDLGGWRAAGGRVDFGQVFRSAALSQLTAADADALRVLNVRHVCDFRGRHESAAAPSRLEHLPEARLHPLPIEPSVGASLRDLVATREATGRDVLSVMRQAYIAYAMEWSHRYRELFGLLLDGDGAVLFHCSAGKDRTGFGAALILSALGVPRAVVMQDYLASNVLWQPDASVAEGLPEPVAKVLLAVHEELLAASFAAIEAEYGSFDRYAVRELGLDSRARMRLRERLVRDAARD